VLYKVNFETSGLKINMAISLRKIDQSDHYISCFDGKKPKKKEKEK
jgi:hypothetical protein